MSSRREFITLLGGAAVSSHRVCAQEIDSRVADLVRAGKIRIALFLPLYAKDPVTGEQRGNLDGVFLIEIIHALAARLGVETQLVGYPTPPEAMNAIKAGACDVGFFGIDPVRAAEADFSPPLVQEDYTYLVPAGSLIHSIADSDRPGIRIAVVRNHASTAALSRVLKHAELVFAETPDTTLELLRSQAGRCNGISPSPAPIVFRSDARLAGAGRPLRRADSRDGGSKGPARPARLHKRVCEERDERAAPH